MDRLQKLCKICHIMLYEYFVFTAVDQKYKIFLMENCMEPCIPIFLKDFD